jgi:hypothetical protein
MRANLVSITGGHHLERMPISVPKIILPQGAEFKSLCFGLCAIPFLASTKKRLLIQFTHPLDSNDATRV